MCGRFTLTIEADKLIGEFQIEDMPPQFQPRYNIAPSQPVLCITNQSPHRLEYLKWGLIPSWAKDPTIGNKLINARGETLQEKPSFRSAFQRRRCLILADGFYEWDHGTFREGKKTPFFFHLADRSPFAFAGLWEVWAPAGGEKVISCTIITAQANECVSPIHDRMPVMLTGDEARDWLAGGSADGLVRLIRPYPADRMARYPVSPIVNRPEVDQPQCILPLAN